MTNQHASEELRERAEKLYSIWSGNHPTIHCNRMPTWDEIGEDERHQWTVLAGRTLLQPKDATPTQTSASAAGDGAQSSVDFHQRRGRDADIIEQALNSYRDFMLDDDFELSALQKIFEEMERRFNMVDRPSRRPDPAGLVAELKDRLDGTDTELAMMLSLLWERSTEEQRETIRMNYPKWKHGDLSTGMNTAALKAMTQTGDGWRDIESAPKDGTRVLLFVPPYGPTTGHCGVKYDGVDKWFCHSVLNADAEPTHWKPLDPPPTPPQTEGDG